MDLHRAYRRQAADHDMSDHWSGPPELVDRLAARLAVGSSGAVLDVGCGVGGPARRLRELTGCSVVAIDVLAAVVAEARRRTGDPGVRFAAAGASALPFADASFQHVWALGVVAHVEDLDGFAREAARVVRPGGVVTVTEALWDGRRVPRFASTAPRPWRGLTVETVASSLEAAGLAVEEHAWPGDGIAGALEPSDEALRADLGDGRLVPRLLLGRKGTS